LVADLWCIRCEYCGYEAQGDCLEAAGADFHEHMVFGVDSTPEHLRYASGVGRKWKYWRQALAVRKAAGQ
jgi:hypothetical protein